MGNGKWEMGNGKWEMGNGKWEMGNGKWEMDKTTTIEQQNILIQNKIFSIV